VLLCDATSYLRMSPAQNNFAICTFNCRGVKSSIAEIKHLCDCNDIVMLQEHWLLPNELGLLNNLHPDFLAKSVSAVDIAKDVLVGRPYGGTAILYRQALASSINIIDSFDPRVCAINFASNMGPMLFACVYMPTDDGGADSLDNFTATCAAVTAILDESDAVHLVVAGDFNCRVNSRFYNILQQFALSNRLCLSDVDRLHNVFTYYSDSGTVSSWIDHILCTQSIDQCIHSIEVLEDYVSSDHRPLCVTFSGLSHDIDLHTCNTDRSHDCSNVQYMDWSKADDSCIASYRHVLDELLCNVNIPVNLFGDSSMCTNDVFTTIDGYYDSVMTSIYKACVTCIPTQRANGAANYIVPGWNDIVADKHSSAREAFMNWVTVGRPRQGLEFIMMKNTRARFKLALRYCKQHEDSMRADAYANSLSANDYGKFWKEIKKVNNAKTTKFANSVAGCHGDEDITEMWKLHFHNLYNSVSDKQHKERFFNRVESLGDYELCNFNVSDILYAIGRQKRGKATGSDGIAMEALMFGGFRVLTHLSLLFNLFVKYSYVPKPFMQCIIIPLVKSKTGSLAEVNNYRAIAISTAISKLFECVLQGFVNTANEFDEYQFGFTANHSTSICTGVFKSTVDYYTARGSHVFASFIDFSKAFDMVNYWILFDMLLDDGCNTGIVKLLAYWYSHQEACVQWHYTKSEHFQLGNGTRQGGVLSPKLFARYIRDLLRNIVVSGIGCNVGGKMINVLAYADDIVIITPSWKGMQQLLDILSEHATLIDMAVNTKKTQCMIFAPKDRSKSVSKCFPVFNVCNASIQFVDRFKYLGHIIANSNMDDDDIQREINNLYVRTNILLHKFTKCSVRVKLTLFKSYCLCLYDVALWKHYHIGFMTKLRSSYNRCIKWFFGFKRSDSMSGILTDLGLSSLDTLMHNSLYSFKRQLTRCNNSVVKHVITIVS
jgi:exonuclease III